MEPRPSEMKKASVDFDPALDSVSEVDREPINGGKSEANWKDARKANRRSSNGMNSGVDAKPQLEDGAD